MPAALFDTSVGNDPASGTVLNSDAMTTIHTYANIGAFCWEGADTNFTATDTAGNTYSKLTKVAASNGDQWLQIFYATNLIAQNNNVVTITTDDSVPVRIVQIRQYSKISLSSAFVAEDSADVGGGDTIECGPLTLPGDQAGGVFVFFAKAYALGNFILGTDMGNLLEEFIAGSEDRIITTPGAYTQQFQFSANTNLFGAAALFTELDTRPLYHKSSTIKVRRAA